jgi:hypothetical protein
MASGPVDRPDGRTTPNPPETSALNDAVHEFAFDRNPPVAASGTSVVSIASHRPGCASKNTGIAERIAVCIPSGFVYTDPNASRDPTSSTLRPATNPDISFTGRSDPASATGDAAVANCSGASEPGAEGRPTGDEPGSPGVSSTR